MEKLIPDKLELQIIKTVLGKEGLNQYNQGKISKSILQPFIPDIIKLSEAYNLLDQERSTLLNSEKSLQAYMLYFLPINLFKLSSLLKNITFPAGKEIRVLDFGCGPGTGSIAAIKHLGSNLEISVYDISGKAEEVARSFIQEFSPGTVFKTPREEWKDKKYDLIIAANSINEIPEGKKETVATKLLSCLSEDGVLLILEPALKIKTIASMKLRDFILNSDKSLTVVFPCTRNDNCPMLKDYPDDWCHGSLSWQGTRLVRQIDELTGFNKHRLKYSAFIFKKHAENLPGCRVVSIPKKDKTGFSAVLCCKDSYGVVKLAKRDKSEENEYFTRAELWDRLNHP